MVGGDKTLFAWAMLTVEIHQGGTEAVLWDGILTEKNDLCVKAILIIINKIYMMTMMVIKASGGPL